MLESHATLFRKWMLQMASNYSVLLYGLGSKRQLLEMFRQNYLINEYDHVTVNGYFPGLTVKQIFSCIIGEASKMVISGRYGKTAKRSIPRSRSHENSFQ